jgi:hypothetical protein
MIGPWVRWVVVAGIVVGTASSPSSANGAELDVCRRATYADPRDNGGALDVRHYELQYDCRAETWFFGATTNRPFANAEVSAFGIWLSTDGNLRNGCSGFDRVLLGGFEEGHEFVEHWRTPTCTATSWRAAPPPIGFVAAGPIGTVGLEFRERWLQGAAPRMRFYGFLATAQGLTDFLPEVGSHAISRPARLSLANLVGSGASTTSARRVRGSVERPALGAEQVRLVPQDHATIDDALLAASDGDVVVVGPGIHRGGFDFRSKAVEIVSSAGALRTTIDLDSGYIDMSDTASLVGFTVIAGSPSEWLRVLDLTPSADGLVVISDNVFDGRGSVGTGAAISSDRRVQIERNVFRSIRCSPGVRSESVVDLMARGPMTVRNNVFFDNPSCSAIATMFGDAPDVTVINNTFVGNEAGLHIRRSAAVASFHIDNNIFQGNAHAVRRQFDGGGLTVVPVTRANVFHNNTQDWNGPNVPTTVQGNLWGDPQFGFAAAGDFRLRRGSIAIDSGVDQSTSGVVDDVTGAPRPFDGNSNGTNEWDIGAVEFQGVDALRRDYVEVSIAVRGVQNYRNYGPLTSGDFNPETTELSVPGPFGTVAGSAQLRGQRGGTATLQFRMSWRANSVLRLGTMRFVDGEAGVDRRFIVVAARRVGLGVWEAWGVDGSRTLRVTIHER